MTVLVTGGAGYIGSHTVHDLVDAGESVVVLDNLSTGFASALPKPMLPIVGDVGDQALVAALIDEHGVEAIIHFAGSTIVPESMTDPLGYYGNNTANSRALIEAAVKGGVRALHLLLDRGGLRQSGARAGRRGRSDRAAFALWLVEADDRGDVARRLRGAPAHATLRCATSTSRAPTPICAPGLRRRARRI